MKKTLIHMIFVTLLFVASAPIPVLADGTNPRPPICPDGGSKCIK